MCTFPRPGARISEVCTRSVHVFFQILSLLHIRRVHGEIPGCTVLGEVHPVGAQNKILISDTDVDTTCNLIEWIQYELF